MHTDVEDTDTDNNNLVGGEIAIPCLAIDPDLSAYVGRGIYDREHLPEHCATHDLIQSFRPLPTKEHLFNPDRIKAIQSAVEIGVECSESQRLCVLDLLAEFADMFALTLSEVRPNHHIEHRINIPADTKLPCHMKAPFLTPLQREWLHKQVDNLLEAGIIT